MVRDLAADITEMASKPEPKSFERRDTLIRLQKEAQVRMERNVYIYMYMYIYICVCVICFLC